MIDLLSFEIAPYDQLCNCVTVELTPEQGRLMDAWPDKRQAIVKAAMLNGQQRHVDGECLICNATGLSPADKIIAEVMAMSDEEVSALLEEAGIDAESVIANCKKLVAELALKHNSEKQVCDQKLLAKYCNGKNIRLVQLRSRTSGTAGPNEYKGEQCLMCAECRKVNSGLFKLVK